MWIIMNDAFVSIVDQPPSIHKLLVRARVKGDIARAMGMPVKEILTKDADYRYRAILPRNVVSLAIAAHVRSIDYGNFKDSVSPKETKRKSVYMRVWTELFALQEKKQMPRLEPWGPLDDSR